jgi:filamin/ABP280 repeat protein
MSPRRPFVNRVLSPRPTRRGWTGVPAGNKLLVSASPASSYQNLVAGTGASIQLATSAGSPIFLAGVVVSVSVSPSVGLTPAPVTATTNSSGVATFTSFTFSGTVGQYTLTFAAAGYASASVAGIQLLAGTFAASGTFANVPTGVVGTPTLVTIQLCDALGNPITFQPGGVTITVTVTGSNPVPQTTATYQANGIYQFAYTPSVSGSDSLAIKLNGTSIKNSPYTSLVSGGTGAFQAGKSLRYGFAALPSGNLGIGPHTDGGNNWDTVEPIYRFAQVAYDPSEFNTFIAAINASDICLAFNPMGAPQTYATGTWGSNASFSEALWRARVDRWRPTADGGALTSTQSDQFIAALAARRILLYLCDEPWHSNWRGTFWPWFVGRAAEYVKSIWPNCLCVARIEPAFIELVSNLNAANGWPVNSNPNYSGTQPANNIQPDGISALSLPFNYWSKMDYLWCTFRGFSRDGNSQYATLFDFFAAGYQKLKKAGYGTIFGENWVNLSDADVIWNAFNQSPAVNDSRIHGNDSSTGQDAVAELSSVATTEKFWAESPARMLAVAQAAANAFFADVPGLSIWPHPLAPICNAGFTTYMKRADYKAGLTSALNACNARSSTFVWRTPK